MDPAVSDRKLKQIVFTLWGKKDRKDQFSIIKMLPLCLHSLHYKYLCASSSSSLSSNFGGSFSSEKQQIKKIY